MNFLKLSLCAGAASAVFASAAWADDQPAPGAAPVAPPATPAAAPAAPAFSLGMDGPIVINPTPLTIKSGSLLGSITINGVVSGIGLTQNNPAFGDKTGLFDLTNGQVLIEKTDGVVQFFVDVGVYSFPALGTNPYTTSINATNANFGPVPMAYLKIAPTSNFSIEAGKLPTLIGAEYNFTFENTNIERGLLWNQENLVNQGVQVNYTAGPVAFNLSVNDGFYSGNLSWLTGAATWTINSANTLELSGGGNLRKTLISTSATPVFLNNSQMYNLIYTHTQGPWTLQGYLQYTSVPSLRFPISSYTFVSAPNVTGSASTFGGALFVDYTFPAASGLSGVSLPARLEYIASSGSLAANSANLLYGPGSNAWSITFTPTYQYKIYFIRGEVSYVQAGSVTPGSVFGPSGLATSQTRGLIEAGVLF